MLRPIIEGEQWKGPEYVRVEAHQQNKPYEVTYRPLAMNVENKKDQVSQKQTAKGGERWGCWGPQKLGWIRVVVCKEGSLHFFVHSIAILLDPHCPQKPGA